MGRSRYGRGGFTSVVLRESILLGLRAVAYFRIGDVETAKRLAAELNTRFPF